MADPQTTPHTLTVERLKRYHKSMDGVLAPDGAWVLWDDVAPFLADATARAQELERQKELYLAQTRIAADARESLRESRDKLAALTQERDRLRDWKESALKSLAKSEKLHKLLPAKYLGWDVYEAAEAELTTLRAALAQMEKERDLAIAHDTQPYPTASAYDAVCAARDKWQSRAEDAEAALAQMRQEHDKEIEKWKGEVAHLERVLALRRGER